MSDPGADESSAAAFAAAMLQTPRGSGGSGQLSISSTSMSPSSSISGGSANTSSSSGSSSSSKSAVSECLSAWLNYFQILNGLCSSGYRLAQSIAALEQWGESPPTGHQLPAGLLAAAASAAAAAATASSAAAAAAPATSSSASGGSVAQYVTAWDDLARATAVATSTVKSHIVNVLQDFVTQSLQPPSTQQQQPPSTTPPPPTGGLTDADTPDPLQTPPPLLPPTIDMVDVQRLRDHNQQIIVETTQTMINIQHQFCVASYESFSTSMCCFVCQAPVGCPHDDGCAMQPQQQHQQQQSGTSPKFGQSASRFAGAAVGPAAHSVTGSAAAGAASISAQASNEYIPFGDSTSFSAAAAAASSGGAHHAVRGTSPPATQQPLHHPPHYHHHQQPSFFDTLRGPLPNPGNLLGMKAPFVHRGGSRSPLNCPLFPLSGGAQRRWSEAAAASVGGSGSGRSGAGFMGSGSSSVAGAGSSGSGSAVGGGAGASSNAAAAGAGGHGASGGTDGASTMDGSNMRRWSMPWEAAPGRNVAGGGVNAAVQLAQQQQLHHQQVVAWHQTRVGPVGTRGGGPGSASQSSWGGRSAGDRSHSITPDSVWQGTGSSSSQERDIGLAEAINLLSLRSTRAPVAQAAPPNIAAPFIEESAQATFTPPDAAPVYEMWSDTPPLMPCIKFNNDLDGSNNPNNR